MKSHTLAKLLLEQPDLPITYHGATTESGWKVSVAKTDDGKIILYQEMTKKRKKEQKEFLEQFTKVVFWNIPNTNP